MAKKRETETPDLDTFVGALPDGTKEARAWEDWHAQSPETTRLEFREAWLRLRIKRQPPTSNL